MKYEKQINMVQGQEQKEREIPLNVPVINIIRHGETSYKEFQDSHFTINPNSPDFKLDSEHLDLTEEGINNIRETAEQIAKTIDKEKEEVILITSPQHRAISSIMIIEEVFKEYGINILNSNSDKKAGCSKGIKTSRHGLGEIPLTNKKEFGNTWLQAHKKYGKEYPEITDKPPAEVHKMVAASLGKELSEIFSLKHENIGKGFNRFLRHIINIEKYLSEETKQQLEGKRLRVICVTHEERLAKFAQQTLGLQKAIEKGQALEIRPEDTLELNKEIDAKVVLFGKNDAKDLSSNIKINFSSKRESK